jgi:membrane-associated HD superfamily phosphohydrolase
VDIEKFRYVGPRPRSRETGIVMLADATEATSSALRPNSEKEIEKLVTTIVSEHVAEGQLDDSGLTLGDVKIIQESLVKTLKGRFHMRVKYPGNEKIAGEEPPPAQPEATPAAVPERAELPQDAPQNVIVES